MLNCVITVGLNVIHYEWRRLLHLQHFYEWDETIYKVHDMKYPFAGAPAAVFAFNSQADNKD